MTICNDYLLRKFSTLREHHEKPPVKIQAQCMEILLRENPIAIKMQALWGVIHNQNKNSIGPSLFELIRLYGRKPDLLDDSSSPSNILPKLKLTPEEVNTLMRCNKVILVDEDDFVEEEQKAAPLEEDKKVDQIENLNTNSIELKPDPIGGSHQQIEPALSGWQWFYQTYVDPYVISPVKSRVLNPAIALYYSKSAETKD